jgi:hypothetical protein
LGVRVDEVREERKREMDRTREKGKVVLMVW